ncbi:MAG TPA: type I DNA topoisomerase [Candidatus Kapabacteria bacterium]|jgi:DNA topoisomerase-1|nr:type I DNA topoisomerase [Candidatus Kapabacteria bacterium]
MAKSLVIVESPAKAKTINKYLGPGYIVEASIGHIKDLPKSKLGVDLDDGFTPHYTTVKGKKDIIDKLKTLAGKSKEVFIATDPDREGEAIAYHLANEVSQKNKNVRRVLFTEITKSGVKEAMLHPREVDRALFDAQQARRVMDRIIGYQVSPVLWKAFIGKTSEALSAGRVQSVALRLICEREEAIDRFQPIPYWNLWADFSTESTEFPIRAKLVSVDGNEIRNPEGSAQDLAEDARKSFIGDETTARGYATDVRSKTYRIASLIKREVRKNSPQPFITSSLQAAASSKLRLNPRRTMQLAQKLYEGVELGAEGLTGLITYMRTDSTRISQEARAEATAYIAKNYGDNYVGAERKEKKSKNAQEAHEAIRPTSAMNDPKSVRAYLEAEDKNLYALYELIWKRFIASQMAPALIDQTTVEIESLERGGSHYRFRATGSVVTFRGYMQVMDDVEDAPPQKNADEEESKRLPNGIQQGQSANIEHIDLLDSQTKAPPRFSESTLVKELESLGIGRPSTYASIVGTIQERSYVEQEERRLFPTKLGIEVNRILVKSFPEIFNVDFTARMEQELDTIATNDRTYAAVMTDFYLPFKNVLAQVEERLAEELPVRECPNCGSKNTEVKPGWWGMYLECKDCGKKTSLKNEGKAAPEKTGEMCPECHEGELLIRSSRYGKFIGCSRYPQCKYTRQMPTGIKCPKCHIGDIVQRRGGKGKRSFWGCARYPDCDFISNDKPVNKPCPICNNNWLGTKWTRDRGEFLKCPNCKREFTDEMNEIVSETKG